MLLAMINYNPKRVYLRKRDSEFVSKSIDKSVVDVETTKKSWSERICENRRDTYAICIQKICDMFEIPIRNDSIQKIADYMDTDNNWTNRILPVLDNIGFACRSIDLKNSGSNPRFVTPSLWIDAKGNCSLLLKKNLERFCYLIQ